MRLTILDLIQALIAIQCLKPRARRRTTRGSACGNCSGNRGKVDLGVYCLPSEVRADISCGVLAGVAQR